MHCLAAMLMFPLRAAFLSNACWIIMMAMRLLNVISEYITYKVMIICLVASHEVRVINQRLQLHCDFFLALVITIYGSHLAADTTSLALELHLLDHRHPKTWPRLGTLLCTDEKSFCTLL